MKACQMVERRDDVLETLGSTLGAMEWSSRSSPFKRVEDGLKSENGACCVLEEGTLQML
jgi:hypothetical protein